MKSTTTKVISFLFASVFLFEVNLVKAQEGDFTEIFRGAPGDAAKYLEGYIGPAMLSFSNGMAGGWYNTAKTHKPGGMDLNFSLNVANMPTSERLFNFNAADFSILRVVDSNGNFLTGSTQMPTLVGGPTTMRLGVTEQTSYSFNGVDYTYDLGSNVVPFQAPGGFDVEDVPLVGVPAPTLQLAIGIFKNTDIKIRFIPEQKFDDYSIKLFGFGIQHDLKQWIPGMKQVPIDFSLFAGTTKLSSDFFFEDNGPDWRVSNGHAEFSARATTFQLLVSKKLSFFTPYLGIGINSVSTSFKVTGRYELDKLTDISGGAFVYDSANGSDDPIELNFTGGGGPRTTLGFRLKLFILTLNMDYTIQKYNTLTLGLGFTFRENKS